MGDRTRQRLTAVCWILILAAPLAAQYDTTTVWPLCGRITESAPPSWMPEDGCPLERAGNPAFSDAPFSATFGPRPLASGDDRYDFHRGVDIATPIGTPIFAIADGIVQTAGVHSSYDDPVIRLRHFRPGETSCSGVGCYNSLYLHVSSWTVAEGEVVGKGQLIGYTGASGATGFEHLHFEVRDAPASDPFSSWSRDAVHPFRAVAYQAANDTSITFHGVDTSNPDATTADLTVASNRFDLVAVRLVVRDALGDAIPQPGGAPDPHGYDVQPPFLDYERANFQYSHKDSTAVPWSSFQQGGDNECPYWEDHGASYDAAIHLDAQDPADYQVGLFNGVRVRTLKYWPSDVRNYEARLEFLELVGPAACIEATAVFASGDLATQAWGPCGGTPPPPPPPASIDLTLSTNKKRNQVKLAWSGATSARVEVWRDGALLTSTANDGGWSDRRVSAGASYSYRVCEQGSTTSCSNGAAIDL